MEHDVSKTPAVWRGVWVFLSSFSLFFERSCHVQAENHSCWIDIPCGKLTEVSINVNINYITTYIQGAKNPAHLSSFKKEGLKLPRNLPWNLKITAKWRREHHHVQQIFIFWGFHPLVCLDFFGGVKQGIWSSKIFSSVSCSCHKNRGEEPFFLWERWILFVHGFLLILGDRRCA